MAWIAVQESFYPNRPEMVLFCKAETRPLERKINLCMLRQGAARGFSAWGLSSFNRSLPR